MPIGWDEAAKRPTAHQFSCDDDGGPARLTAACPTLRVVAHVNQTVATPNIKCSTAILTNDKCCRSAAGKLLSTTGYSGGRYAVGRGCQSPDCDVNLPSANSP